MHELKAREGDTSRLAVNQVEFENLESFSKDYIVPKAVVMELYFTEITY